MSVFSNLQYRIARGTTALFRVKTLPLARHLFRSTPTPLVLGRPLFGYTMWIDVSRGQGNQLLYLDPDQVLEERALLTDLLRPGMRVVDVGAATGYALLLFERSVGPAGHVACIEPSPENLQELDLNIQRNRFTNVVVHRTAVGDEAGRASLSGGVNCAIDGAGAGVHTVAVSTLDQLVQERVDLIKIDVEGYEAHVLQGARAVIRNHRPMLVIEMHAPKLHQHGRSVGEIYRELEPLYRDVACYEVPTLAHDGIVGRVRARYGALKLRQVPDVPSYIAACDAPGGPERFWITCRNRDR